MTTKEELTSSIEPGSLPYGARADLEAGLGVPGPGGAAGGGVPPMPQGPIDDGLDDMDPLDLLGDDGPQPGSLQSPQVSQDFQPDFVERLRAIAMYARTPHLRAQARAALRRYVLTGVGPDGQ